MIVFSFSLFGDAILYNKGIIENARILNSVFPKYRMNVYVADDVPSQTVKSLTTFPNVKIIRVRNRKSKFENTLDRFLAIDDPDCSIMFSRDADSRVHLRDQACIVDFINSDKQLHIIRDHPAHGAHILAGLFGLRKTALDEPMNLKISRFLEGLNTRRGVDQLFLKHIIYPILNKNALIHDDRGFFESANMRTKFRIKTKNKLFCGKKQDYREDGLERQTYSDLLDYGIEDRFKPCENKTCIFIKHSDPSISKTHCCRKCARNGKAHGSSCEGLSTTSSIN